MIEDKAKVRVRTLINYAEKAVKELKAGEAISQCNEVRLMYHLRDIYKAQGGADVLINIFPDDKETKILWHDANELHKSGNIYKEKFSRECNCERVSTK